VLAVLAFRSGTFSSLTKVAEPGLKRGLDGKGVSIGELVFSGKGFVGPCRQGGSFVELDKLSEQLIPQGSRGLGREQCRFLPPGWRAALGEPQRPAGCGGRRGGLRALMQPAVGSTSRWEVRCIKIVLAGNPDQRE
jgi:hypothetical protein